MREAWVPKKNASGWQSLNKELCCLRCQRSSVKWIDLNVSSAADEPTILAIKDDGAKLKKIFRTNTD